MSKEIISGLVDRIDFLSAQQRAAAAAGNYTDVEICENRLFIVRAMLRNVYEHQKTYGANKLDAQLKQIILWFLSLMHFPLKLWGQVK